MVGGILIMGFMMLVVSFGCSIKVVVFGVDV